MKQSQARAHSAASGHAKAQDDVRVTSAAPSCAAVAVSVARDQNRSVYIRLHGSTGSVFAHARLSAADATTLADQILDRVEAARPEIPLEGEA